jgi:hypothetical protein
LLSCSICREAKGLVDFCTVGNFLEKKFRRLENWVYLKGIELPKLNPTDFFIDPKGVSETF